MNIELISTIQGHEQQLTALLIDCVNSGASVGFHAPLTQSDAGYYWYKVDKGLQAGERLLVVTFIGDKLVGAIQLSLCLKANGLHRAEVEKLMVHTQYRQHGIAKQLLAAIEDIALGHQRTLLVLDTRTGDAASGLYRKQGYIEVGKIPQFVTNSNGKFESTTIFYKQLGIPVSS